MAKRLAVIIVGVLLVAMLAGWLTYRRQQTAYLHQMKAELVTLAHNRSETARHVMEIKRHLPDPWTDGRVGITADGYVFCYDLHESHGADYISDVHIFYLPDEDRFIVNYTHWCVDLSKGPQPKNKKELLLRFASGITR